MRTFSTIKEAVDFRITESDKNYWINDLWNEEIKTAIVDIEDTIQFINNCNDEEFFWLSEVFEDIVERTLSQNFVDALQERFNRVREDNYNQSTFCNEYMRTYVDYSEYIRSVGDEIESAKCRLDYLLNN